jgi:hypothetical protein
MTGRETNPKGTLALTALLSNIKHGRVRPRGGGVLQER